MSCRFIEERAKERLHKKIERITESGCWIWMGCTTRAGYGQAQYNKNRTVAHRIFYRIYKGEIPEGLDLDHLCRVTSCVNPDHLEPATRQTNIRRAFEARGCKNGHPYNEEDFSIVKRSNGTIERRCKICHRERNKKHKSGNRKKWKQIPRKLP